MEPWFIRLQKDENGKSRSLKDFDKIKTIEMLRKQDIKIYLRTCKTLGRDTISKYYPKGSDIRKAKLYFMAKNEYEKINQFHYLYDSLNAYCSKTNKTFDVKFQKKMESLRWFGVDKVKNKQDFIENNYFKKNLVPERGKYRHNLQQYKKFKMKWYKLMVEKYPHISEGISEKSFKRMISLMPKNVKFAPNQKWKSSRLRYKFIDEKYGIFSAVPSKLMSRVWKNGVSGHPKATQDRKFKSVINLDTGETFDSLLSASDKYKADKTGLSKHLSGKSSSYAGCRWAFAK